MATILGGGGGDSWSILYRLKWPQNWVLDSDFRNSVAKGERKLNVSIDRSPLHAADLSLGFARG